MLTSRKQGIQQRFSRAAGTYDAKAEVQKALGLRLFQELPPGCGSEPARILEIGCGTGQFTALLGKRYPEARITALDFAEGMVQLARKRLEGQDNIAVLCEDGEQFLAAASDPFALICANATLQWFDDLEGALRHIARLLSEQGLFLGALFGPRTFAELAQGLSQVFAQEVCLPPQAFPAGEQLREMLSRVFSGYSVKEEHKVKSYPTLFALLDHIRKTGTGGGQLPGPLTRGGLRRLEDWFQTTHGGYPVTYQTFVIRGEK